MSSLPGAKVDPFEFNSKTAPHLVPLEGLSIYVQLAREYSEREKRFHGVLLIRKLLSVESNPPIDEVVRTGIVQELCSYCRMSEEPKLQLEAAWALTNICSGTSEVSHRVLREYPAIDAFAEILRTGTDAEGIEQAVWGLGNIAGDCWLCRNLVLTSCGGTIVQHLLDVFGSEHAKDRISLVRNTAWCLSNLCRGAPAAPSRLVHSIVDFAATHVMEDSDAAIDQLWLLSYVADSNFEVLDLYVHRPEFHAVLLKALHAGQKGLVSPAARLCCLVLFRADVQVVRKLITDVNVMSPLSITWSLIGVHNKSFCSVLLAKACARSSLVTKSFLQFFSSPNPCIPPQEIASMMAGCLLTVGKKRLSKVPQAPATFETKPASQMLLEQALKKHRKVISADLFGPSPQVDALKLQLQAIQEQMHALSMKKEELENLIEIADES